MKTTQISLVGQNVPNTFQLKNVHLQCHLSDCHTGVVKSVCLYIFCYLEGVQDERFMGLFPFIQFVERIPIS